MSAKRSLEFSIENPHVSSRVRYGIGSQQLLAEVHNVTDQNIMGSWHRGLLYRGK
jgi:hypothetical protein